MKRLFLAAALAMGCGPAAPPVASWGGTYLGSVRTRGTCSDGLAVDTSDSLRLVVTQQAGNLLMDDGGDCSTFVAEVDGRTASMNPKLCPDAQGQAGTVHAQFTGGTLTLSDNDATVSYSLTQDISVTNGASTVRTCKGTTVTGSLARQ